MEFTLQFNKTFVFIVILALDPFGPSGPAYPRSPFLP